jgi:hypothetical protein
MEAIRQKIVKFIIKAMATLDFILSIETPHENWNKCLRVYFSICK